MVAPVIHQFKDVGPLAPIRKYNTLGIETLNIAGMIRAGLQPKALSKPACPTCYARSGTKPSGTEPASWKTNNCIPAAKPARTATQVSAARPSTRLRERVLGRNNEEYHASRASPHWGVNLGCDGMEQESVSKPRGRGDRPAVLTARTRRMRQAPRTRG